MRQIFNKWKLSIINKDSVKLKHLSIVRRLRVNDFVVLKTRNECVISKINY
jgi:hypothetical protein